MLDEVKRELIVSPHYRSIWRYAQLPTVENWSNGFRLAAVADPVPEPSTALLVAAGLVSLAIRQRRN